MLEVERVKDGYILIGNEGHAHGDKKYCQLIKNLILAKRKPTIKDLEYLQRNDIRGPNHYRITSLKTIEESILKIVSESRYRRWGKTKKYVNKPKHVRRAI